MKRIMKHLKSVLLLLAICLAIQFTLTVPTQAATKKVTVDKPKLVSAKLLKPQTIQIKWKKVKNASGYRIYRKTSDSKWKTLNTITKNSTVSLTDTNLEPGTKYYYTVKAFKKDGKKTVWSKYDTKGVYAVTELQQVSINYLEVLSYSEISLSWNKVVNVDGYYIYRHENGNNTWNLIYTIEDRNTTRFIDSSLVDYTKYFYTIQAYKNIDGITYKSKLNSKGWSRSTKRMTEEEAIESEITETPYGIFVKLHNRSKNYYGALDIGLEAYDVTGKLVYKKTFENSFYDVKPDRTFYASFGTPKSGLNQYVDYSYCKVVPKLFGTFNYDSDIYDKINISSAYINSKDANQISVIVTNTTDQVVDYGKIIFLFYKNGALVRCASQTFQCNVCDECEVSVGKYPYDFNYNTQYIDYDEVNAVISHAFVGF